MSKLADDLERKISDDYVEIHLHVNEWGKIIAALRPAEQRQ